MSDFKMPADTPRILASPNVPHDTALVMTGDQFEDGKSRLFLRRLPATEMQESIIAELDEADHRRHISDTVAAIEKLIARPAVPRMPQAPAGYVACRVIGPMSLTTHLVALDEHGSNGGRPTVCGLTRFDRVENGRRVPNTADLPGWGMGNTGVTGDGVVQLKCAACYRLSLRETAKPTPTEEEPNA